MQNDLLIQCIFDVLKITSTRKQAEIVLKAQALQAAIKAEYTDAQLAQIADIEKRKQD